VQHAERAPVGPERNGGERADALTQQRAEDLRRRQVLDEHRLAGGRHPAGDAAPDGHPHLLHHLLLQPRRRGDGQVPLVVGE
jgi:hypothetical protein